MLLKKLGSFFLETIQVIVFAVSIFLFVYLLILQPHKIKGASMEPNFHDGQYLLTDKLSYRLDNPHPGDVIVFKAPPSFKEEFIKRIIAQPEDTVKLEQNHLYVNNTLKTENYIPSSFYTYNGIALTEGQTLTLGTNEYFVMGDNREHSFDSRHFGIVERSKITGKAWFIYWPPSDIGIVPKAEEY